VNHIALIWGSEKQKYFCKWGWTGKSPSSLSDLPVGQITASPSLAKAASVARMSKATSGADLSSIDPACRCAHAGYLLVLQARYRGCYGGSFGILARPRSVELRRGHRGRKIKAGALNEAAGQRPTSATKSALNGRRWFRMSALRHNRTFPQGRD